MLLGCVLVVMAITIIQERRTERALDALRDLSSPRALVIRDGAHRRTPGHEVVPGDFVVLSEGDRIPAPGLIARQLVWPRRLQALAGMGLGESVHALEVEHSSESSVFFNCGVAHVSITESSIEEQFAAYLQAD